MDDQFILVVDDANFDGVVEGTMQFVEENQLEVFLRGGYLVELLKILRIGGMVYMFLF